MYVAVKAKQSKAKAAHKVRWSLKSYLSALQVPPHGSLAADGQASLVQHAQEKQH